MKKFTAVFTASFKYLWRNPVSVTVLIVFPIVIILILGNALAAIISPENNFEPISVAAAAESDLNTFLKSDEISRFLDVTFTDRENTGELLANGSVIAVITEEAGEITVTRTASGSAEAKIVISIVDSYKQIGAAAFIAAVNGGDMNGLTEIINAGISVAESPLGKRVPTAIDYYAVTMLVMILLYTGMNGFELFKKSLLSETGNRVLTTPVSKPVLIGGLLAASTVTSYLQGMITFVFSGLVYGVYWGERIPLVLLTLFGVTLFSQAFSIFLIMFFKNANAAVGAMQALVWVMTFVSKGYSKIPFGEAEKVFQYVPNALAHTVIFGAAYGGNEAKMTFDLCLLFGYGIVLFILAFLLGRRRLA